MEFPSKQEVVEKFLRKYEEVMISQSSVDFTPRNPNLESLTFEQVLSFLDESWSTLDQMMNVTSKWGCWPQLTFCPIQLIFNHLSNCLRKLDLWGLKLDMENLWSIWGGMMTIGDGGSPSGSEDNQTLVWVDFLGEGLSDQPLRNPWVWMYGMS